LIGSTHAAEIPFVFGNTQGQGYAVNPVGGNGGNPLTAVADLMSKSWVSFIHDRDPTHHGRTKLSSFSLHGIFLLVANVF
jgi:hypothetical protein